MKLKELIIPDYKGFVNFRMTFHSESPVTTVIGQNGVGKSNLIEIIVSIFKAIDLDEDCEFSYTLIYECRGHDIQVRYDIADKSNNLVNVNGEKKSFTYLRKYSKEYLPLNIFTYYSGTNERVENLFLKHQKRFYDALTKGDDQLIRRFFYCRDVHSFFVLLAFLVDDDPACQAIIDKLEIESLDSVLFCLKKPYWYKGKPNDIMKKEGDPRFWFSRGVVKEFLDKLWDQAIAPIDNRERKTTDFRGRTESQDRLYLFLPDRTALEELNENYPSTTSLFKHLESTYIADLLESIDVTVTLSNGKQVTFDQLSEGERQLLTVLGLMKFTRDDESLFLLDEPDTHLNPRWKLKYFDQIKEILDHSIDGSDKTAWESSQVILTTHDPLMLTSLKAEQVRVISEDSGGKYSTIPEEDPSSLGVEAIIQSELYGIRTSLDVEIQNEMDRRNELLAKLDGISVDDSSEIIQGPKPEGEERLDIQNELNKSELKLEKWGFSSRHPNPYFSNFAKALSQFEEFKKPSFTEEEYERVNRFTAKLLARAKEASSD